MLARFKHDIWLIAFIAFSLTQRSEIPNWPDAWLSLLIYAPLVLSLLGVFISVYLNRLQPVLLLLSLTLLNLAFLYYQPYESSDDLSMTAAVLFPLLGVLLPLNWIVWLTFSEKGFYAKSYALGLIALLLSQVIAVFWLMNQLPLSAFYWLYIPVSNEMISLSFASFISFAIAWFWLVLMSARSVSKLVILKVGIYSLLLLGIALNHQNAFGVVAWLSSFVALFIILSLIFDAHHLAYTDQLTGLNSRRALLESYSGLKRNYAIAMIDVDHFKKFNDTYGHDVGDEVLKMVANCLSTIQYGQLYRYGGEEFTVVFKHKSVEQIRTALDQVRLEIEKTPLKVQLKRKKTITNVTVSIGVAVADKNHNTPEKVIKLADNALYKAKDKGRNCLEFNVNSRRKSKVQKGQ